RRRNQHVPTVGVVQKRRLQHFRVGTLRTVSGFVVDQPAQTNGAHVVRLSRRNHLHETRAVVRPLRARVLDQKIVLVDFDELAKLPRKGGQFLPRRFGIAKRRRAPPDRFTLGQSAQGRNRTAQLRLPATTTRADALVLGRRQRNIQLF